MRPSWIVALPLLLAGCGSSEPKGTSLGGPSPFQGFPSQWHTDVVYAQGEFRTNHASELGGDLVERADVLPVFLELREQTPGVRLDEDALDMKLFLNDGTSLVSVSPEDVAENAPERTAEKVLANALKQGMLGGSPRRGYVFFRLAPADDFLVDGRRIVHAQDGRKRTFEISQSLISFDVLLENTRHSVFVGIQR